jgi:ribosomal protein S18 acetylase RimI-like enzyme
MTVLTCGATRRRLAAYHDGEMEVRERIAVQNHLEHCPPCRRELGAIESVGEALRAAAAPGPADDWTGLQPGVISRMRAEAHESWTARVGRLFDDLHLVWIGLAATAATFVCGAIVLGMLHFASPERDDSLAAIIAVMAAPSGSDLNPASLDSRYQLPGVPSDGVVSASLERSGSQGEMALTLSAVVTREGRIHGLEVLSNDRDRGHVSQLLDAISRAQLEPARYGADPVAVNLVWLVEHMTVKGKQRG